MREPSRLVYQTIGREQNTHMTEPLATRRNVVNLSPFFVFVEEQTRNFSFALAAQLPPKYKSQLLFVATKNVIVQRKIFESIFDDVFETNKRPKEALLSST